MIRNQLNEFASLLRENLEHQKTGDRLLSDFSPWLSQFRWYCGENFIRLPYKNDINKPNDVHEQLNIIKIDSKVSILRSMRRPIKLRILCSNGKYYTFLIKSGEDLRQDERIQQMFQIMNNYMHADRLCSQRNLSIDTYFVIPITINCGLIEWIENNQPISQKLSNQLRTNMLDNAREYLLSSSSTTSNANIDLTEVVLKKSQQEVISDYISIDIVTNHLPHFRWKNTLNI